MWGPQREWTGSTSDVESRKGCCGRWAKKVMDWWIPPGVPRGSFFAVMWLVTCEGFMWNCVLVYIGFLVEDYVTNDPNTVGFYTGFPSMVYHAGQLLSVFVSGYASDKWGRRVVLLIGACGSFVTAIVMCFTCNFLYVVICRGFNGLFCAQIGVIKAYLSDIAGKDNRVIVFSRFSLLSAFGGIAGSLLAGYTVRPAVLYPNIVGSDAFLARFPYFIPNFIQTLSYSGAILASLKWLKDVPRAPPKIELMALTKESETSTSVEIYEQQIETIASLDTPVAVTEKIVATMSEGDETLRSENPEGIIVSTTPSSEEEKNPVKKTWTRRDWIIPILLCIVYGVSGLAVAFLKNIIPIWAMSDIDSGGLGFNTKQVGILNSIFGGLTIVIQLFFYDPVVKKLHLLWTLRIGCILAVPAFLAQPTINRLADINIVMWVVLIALCAVQQYAVQLNFTPIFTLISNSVDAVRSGKVNGIGQTVASIGRCVGPLSATVLFAWTLENGLGFPLDYRFSFIVTASIPLISLLLTIRLPKSLNYPYQG
ncbi:transporter, major facilitator family protein [Pelomyxa schiedti]|nr:transporter, major facilitator family protein [Pelomyxa schiedti]